MDAQPNTLTTPQSPGNGLRLRLATPADADALAEFNTRVHREEDEPEEFLSAWTGDLMSDRHPTTSPADFVLVEDTTAGNKLVATGCLIPQVWRFDDLLFPVGRPELIGTHPAYRRRGLARAVMAAIHQLSAGYGHIAQGITGIDWFYRQFGYEYALPLGGGRVLGLGNIPPLKNEAAQPYRLRPAAVADIPALMRLYRHQCAGKLVSVVIDRPYWEYNLAGHSPGSAEDRRYFVILNKAEEVVGYYRTPARLWGSRLGVRELTLATGVLWPAALPAVLNALKAQGEAMSNAEATAGTGNRPPLTGIRFMLGPEHPLYEYLAAKLEPPLPPYAWYIRLPDLHRFLRHISPVLERRLANSMLAGYSGELNMTFYRDGLQLVFEDGALRGIHRWQAPETNEHWDGAGFPPLVFLQLLFGFRSLAELRQAFPDCWADKTQTLLLNALFPKQASWVLPLA
ncbi:MAG: GNAT family N-acetyltransferase [Anaerolineae bacterium]